jgi:hypothetical protein
VARFSESIAIPREIRSGCPFFINKELSNPISRGFLTL